MKVELGKVALWEKIYQQHMASWDGRAMETWFCYRRKITQIDSVYTNTMLMLMFAIARGIPPWCAVPTPLSLHDWEMNVTSNATVLSPSGKKDNFSSFQRKQMWTYSAQRRARAPLPMLGAILQQAARAGAPASPLPAPARGAGASLPGTRRQGSSASREAMPLCPPASLQLSRRR